jgi:hypothetical protein
MLQLDQFTTTKDLLPLTITVGDYQADVEKVVVKAWAQALADARDKSKSTGCLAWVNAGGCIWTQGHPDEQHYCANCTAVGYSAGAVDSIDAIAEAGTL